MPLSSFNHIQNTGISYEFKTQLCGWLRYAASHLSLAFEFGFWYRIKASQQLFNTPTILQET